MTKNFIFLGKFFKVLLDYSEFLEGWFPRIFLHNPSDYNLLIFQSILKFALTFLLAKNRGFFNKVFRRPVRPKIVDFQGFYTVHLFKIHNLLRTFFKALLDQKPWIFEEYEALLSKHRGAVKKNFQGPSDRKSGFFKNITRFFWPKTVEFSSSFWSKIVDFFKVPLDQS